MAPIDQTATIANRFVPVYISNVFDVQPVNVELFDDDVGSYLGGRMERAKGTQNRRGMLKSADIEAYLTVSRQVPMDVLVMNVAQSLGITSRVTTITLGATLSEDQFLALPEIPTTFRVVIPVCRSLSNEVPLLDELHSRKQHIIHHVVEIRNRVITASPSVGFAYKNGPDHLIRLKIAEKEGTVEVVSVSTHLIDIARIKESANNVTLCVKDGWNWLKQIPTRCFSARAQAQEQNKPSAPPSAVQNLHMDNFTNEPTFTVDENSKENTSLHSPLVSTSDKLVQNVPIPNSQPVLLDPRTMQLVYIMPNQNMEKPN